MTRIVWTDRSRIESYQSCARKRWLEYHEASTGIQPQRKPLALCVGGSVHVGLEHLLLGESEDSAVTAALADFSQHQAALALDTTEEAALATPDPAALATQLASTALDLGMAPSDPSLVALMEQHGNAAKEFDGWLYKEQAALVEGMVRAYARRRLAPLLAEFEVLEVEREGDWELASGYLGSDDPYSLCFMSRPDALLRSRTDNSLYLLSFKTAATWDIRKARDAEHDMQGLSEGVEVERRLGEWWNELYHEPEQHKMICQALGISDATYKYLTSLPAPPRILGIRYEYLLKGSRYADRDLSSRFGVNVWAQRSHLIRAYSNESAGQWCWSYDHLKDDGSTSKLYYKTWRPRAVWESMPIKSWIDLLDDTQMAMSAYDSTVGQEPREVGYKSAAQAQGFTTEHPLDAIFPAPLVVYRSDDQLRDWIEQVEASESRVAEAVARVDNAPDEGERRHLLNVHFPMSRRSCSYPTECAFAKTVCFGGEDAQRDPLGTGAFRRRVPNHEAERLAGVKL
jgi:hypothetical protein